MRPEGRTAGSATYLSQNRLRMSKYPTGGLREWAGLRFNAEVFSVNAANKRLLKNRSLAVK